MRVGVDNQQVLICVTDAKIAKSTEMVVLKSSVAKQYLRTRCRTTHSSSATCYRPSFTMHLCVSCTS